MTSARWPTTSSTGRSAGPPAPGGHQGRAAGEPAQPAQPGHGIAAGDPFGFGFAWDQWDTTAHGLGLAVMAREYDQLAGRPGYAAWGQRWLDDVLGTNAWGVSLIVGDGTVFPDCMQHQVTNLIGSHDGSRRYWPAPPWKVRTASRRSAWSQYAAVFSERAWQCPVLGVPRAQGRLP